ncbi:MAG: ComEA family DNA-binding protein [Deltaproteobacteria bacterium]|nr:ComEA family DNA-binding protein [Deltaproteobacteria bacterium]
MSINSIKMKREAQSGAEIRDNESSHNGQARDIALLTIAVFLAAIYLLREFYTSKESAPIPFRYPVYKHNGTSITGQASFVSSAEQTVFEVEYPGGVSKVYLRPKQESEIKSGSKIAIATNKDKEGSVYIGLMSGEKHIIFSIPLDINQATAKDFEALPDIGPKLAERIVETRERLGGFKTIDDLQKVKGVGSKKLDKLKTLITCYPPH